MRDALLGRPSADIDLATPALPDEIIAALEKAGIKAVPTGIDHGTVTAVVDIPWAAAAFRDHDACGAMSRPTAAAPVSRSMPIGARTRRAAISRSTRSISTRTAPCTTRSAGWPILRRIACRFVGEPARRIAEDVLRVLRYYRFEARFGRGEGDAAARAACRDAVPLLPTLSAERVAQELLRLLSVADPVPALRMMREDGVLAAILPEATRLDRLQRLIQLEPAPDPVRRLAALVDVDAEGAARLAERLRLSNAMRDRLAGLATPWPLDPAGRREGAAAGAVPARRRPRSRSGAASGRRGAPRPGEACRNAGARRCLGSSRVSRSPGAM